MQCLRCQNQPTVERRLDLQKYNIQGDILRIDCSACNNFVTMKMDGKIVNVNNICNDISLNEWREIQTNRERLIYYILCQIVYLENDSPDEEKLESPYDIADESDIVIIRWLSGIPIGFYTVKPKGTEIYMTGERYHMPVLDTAYIRSEYRKKGFGSEILSNFITCFPNEDLGFSKPISKAMLRVLKIFLVNHKGYRLRFWEIADNDMLGSQQLIWCRIRD